MTSTIDTPTCHQQRPLNLRRSVDSISTHIVEYADNKRGMDAIPE
jgi:hypothetical protein